MLRTPAPSFPGKFLAPRGLPSWATGTFLGTSTASLLPQKLRFSPPRTEALPERWNIKKSTFWRKTPKMMISQFCQLIFHSFYGTRKFVGILSLSRSLRSEEPAVISKFKFWSNATFSAHHDGHSLPIWRMVTISMFSDGWAADSRWKSNQRNSSGKCPCIRRQPKLGEKRRWQYSTLCETHWNVALLIIATFPSNRLDLSHCL